MLKFIFDMIMLGIHGPGIGFRHKGIAVILTWNACMAIGSIRYWKICILRRQLRS